MGNTGVVFMGEENQWSLWIIDHISNHYFELFVTEQLQKINSQLATQQHLPQQKLLHLGWPAACISCQYTYFMQHQQTPHHPIFTIFIKKKKKLRIKAVNFQIFFTIKNFRILQWMPLLLVLQISLALVASTFIWLSESLKCKQSVPATKPAHRHAPHLYRSQDLQHDDGALA